MSSENNKIFLEHNLELMVVGKKVFYRPTNKDNTNFKPISRKKLRDRYRNDSSVWKWLRTKKIYRPSYKNLLIDKKDVVLKLTSEDERFIKYLQHKGGFETYGEVVSYCIRYASIFAIEVIAPLVTETVKAYGSVRKAIIFLKGEHSKLKNMSPMDWVAAGNNIRDILEVLESKKKL